VQGSNASISLGSYGIGNNADQEFVFDAAGITTINATDIILNEDLAGNVAGGDLFVDLTAFTFAGSETFTLIDGESGLDLGETFNSETITGLAPGYTANVSYDTTNHDVLLNVVIPEPASLALLGLGGLCLLGGRHRRA